MAQVQGEVVAVGDDDAFGARCVPASADAFVHDYFFVKFCVTLGLQVDFVEVEGVPARVVGAYRAKAAVAEGDMPPVGVEGHFLVGLGKLGQRLHGDVFASLGHVVATVVLAGDAGVGADYKLVEFKFLAIISSIFCSEGCSDSLPGKMMNDRGCRRRP